MIGVIKKTKIVSVAYDRKIDEFLLSFIGDEEPLRDGTELRIVLTSEQARELGAQLSSYYGNTRKRVTGFPLIDHLLEMTGVPFSGKATYKCTCGKVFTGENPDEEFVRHAAEMREKS